MSLDFVDIVAIIGISQGIFLAIILKKNTANNQKANKVLSLLLFLSCIMLATRVLIMNSTTLDFYRKLLLAEPIIFMYGPLSFYYVKFLMQKENQWQRKWLNFIPAILYLIFLVYLNVISTERFSEMLSNQELLIPYIVIELLAIVHNVYFWILSKKFLFTYELAWREQISYDQKAIKFVSIAHYLSGAVLLFWTIGFIGLNILQSSYFIFAYNATWIALSILIYIIGYFAIKQPEIFKLSEVDLPFTKTNSEKSSPYDRLQKDEVIHLESRLNDLMLKEKRYLDNELTLVSLAHELKTTTNNLSWLLNKVYNTTFYDFINEYRIHEFIEKVKNYEHRHRTLLALSMEVGFNSKSTFNKAFKLHQNDTPSNYIKKMQL